MQTNRPVSAPRTFEGGAGIPLSPLDTLRRAVLSCMLWESSFYEGGASIADRIKILVPQCEPGDVLDLAWQARNEMRLRHVPLLLVRELARHPKKPKIMNTLAGVIQRADELPEFLSIYWQDNESAPLSSQVKKGLAQAFCKFDAYQLAKYNRKNKVTLRDVLFMVHAKPKDEEQAKTWKQLVDGTLPAPDTWEVALSAGADKAATFTRLMSEGKLGYMALLRNLRNMEQAGVSEDLVAQHLLAGAKTTKALPFRYVAAARAVPSWQSNIERAMLLAMEDMPRMEGKTVLLVDVSGSMDSKLSEKSDLSGMDAACALAILLAGICSDLKIYTFSNEVVKVKLAENKKGMALADEINQSQPHRGTYLGKALKQLKTKMAENKRKIERLIVITDEQSSDSVGSPGDAKGYMINIASYQTGVGYGNWTRINGFSESVIRYIQAVEEENTKLAGAKTLDSSPS